MVFSGTGPAPVDYAKAQHRTHFFHLRGSNLQCRAQDAVYLSTSLTGGVCFKVF